MKKKVVPAELTPSEQEEMIPLRAENERMQAEISRWELFYKLGEVQTPRLLF